MFVTILYDWVSVCVCAKLFVFLFYFFILCSKCSWMPFFCYLALVFGCVLLLFNNQHMGSGGPFYGLDVMMALAFLKHHEMGLKSRVMVPDRPFVEVE